MRFGEETVGLNRADVERLRDMVWKNPKALGSSALLGAIYQESAKTDVKLLDNMGDADIPGATANELRNAQFEMGDRYTVVPITDTERELLEQIFAEYMVDDPFEVSTSQALIEREPTDTVWLN